MYQAIINHYQAVVNHSHIEQKCIYTHCIFDLHVTIIQYIIRKCTMFAFTTNK